jgi:hexosaminidase
VKGAYTPKLTYSIADIKELNTYAANRGVRLFIEIDVPGHAASWQYGYPRIMADCINKVQDVTNFALNPTLDETYVVIEKILTDIIATTGIKYFHLGGDEVNYKCWAKDDSITSYMATNGIANYDELMSIFVQRVDAIVRKLGATPVHWEEVFTAGAKVEPDTVFEVWTDQSQMAVLADANYTIISAPKDRWYLDNSFNTWNKMYEYDPVSKLSDYQKSLVLGGEVAMWGEHIDENNMESIVYPRASSVGERLWSDESVRNYVLAKDRFQHQRCRLVARGFRASAIEPGFCEKNPV